jgi:hypothetical protein
LKTPGRLSIDARGVEKVTLVAAEFEGREFGGGDQQVVRHLESLHQPWFEYVSVEP